MADDYTVTGQRQTTILDPTGNYTDGWEITFVDAHKNVGKIQVPMSAYTVDNVKALIEAQVAVLDAVHKL